MDHHTILDEDRLRWSLLLYDRTTVEHCDRVGRLSGVIAARLGWSVEACRKLARAARLHDIGKLKTPLVLLQKPGRLTVDEYAEIQRHPEDGVAIVAQLVSDPLLIAVIGSHHERWNGSGYPYGLSGEAIPLAARIAAVADVYDALCHQRPYHTPCSPGEAYAYLCAHSGTLFDAQVITAFASVALDQPVNSARWRFADYRPWHQQAQPTLALAGRWLQQAQPTLAG